jgi:UDP-glucose 4-epimerase
VKRVLVTGGAGRLGRYVVEALGDDFHVTVFDRIEPAFDCAFVQGDILDQAVIAEAVNGQDSIIHLAALDADVDATDAQFIRVNVEGTWNLFDCARNAGVKKIVHCSSVAAVNICPENPPRYLPVDIEHHVDPETAYGLSKLMGEKIARRFFMLGGMDIICLRPTLVLPPEYVYDVAITSAEVDGTPVPAVASDPSWKSFGEVIPGSRSYVDSRDAATAFRAALEADHIPWGIFYVASTDTYSALPTLDVVKREFGVVPVLKDPDRYVGDSRASIYDTSETTKSLGWKPVHGWPEILNEVLATTQITK